jgi:hypothetical protein
MAMALGALQEVRSPFKIYFRQSWKFSEFYIFESPRFLQPLQQIELLLSFSVVEKS